jgi:alpha-galactosidase/6-phospho-beta-glucosidase family protein
MKKIAFIGAGSFVFTRNLVRDILSFPAFQDAVLALVDIDDDRLEFSKKTVEKIVGAGKYPARILAVKNRAEALEGADGVLCTVMNGGLDVWRYDLKIPKEFGVDICIGDTRGPSGIFRALRNIPLIEKAIENPEVYKSEIVRIEMFKALGFFPTESSGHNSEYNPWFRKRPDLIEKYCGSGTGWNPGLYAASVKRHELRGKNWRKDIEAWIGDPETDLKRGALSITCPKEPVWKFLLWHLPRELKPSK